LKVLTPQIMPAQGSRTDLGLIKAHELLKQAGIAKGQVLLIADGVSQEAASLKAAKDLFDNGHTVSVMAVGTEKGGKLNFRNNVSRIVKLDAHLLNNIAIRGGGNYHLMTTNNNDLKSLLTSISDNSSLEEKLNTEGNNNDENEIQNREWHSTGPLLVLILLPFAALAFRRGWLLNIAGACLLFGLIVQPQQVIAAESNRNTLSQSENQAQSNWQNLVERLSKNKAQRANDAFNSQQYEKARDLSDKPLSRGSAEYKLENYEDALNNFKQAEGADARYNEGNTLAKLQKYKEAIAAYDEALNLNSSMQDALDNKKTIEDFLKQQQQSGKKSESSNDNQQGSSDSQNDQQEQQSADSSDQGEQSQDKQSDSQSASKDSEQEEKDKEQQNQFSEANKDLDNNKKEAEEEQVQSAQEQSAQSNKDDDDQQSQAEKEQQAATEAEENQVNAENKQAKKEQAEELSQEEKMAAEQWLRRIPDDPGGLLRRKFRHQYNQSRRDSPTRSTEQPW